MFVDFFYLKFEEYHTYFLNCLEKKINYSQFQVPAPYMKTTTHLFICQDAFIFLTLSFSPLQWKSTSLHCENSADFLLLSIISTYLACINATTLAALCAPWNFYFLISSCVIAALAVPRLGDIIIVITTSSSSCRQIILPGSFFFFSFFLELHRGGEITFFTKPLCCVYCDSGHTPSCSPSLSCEFSTIGVMVNRRGAEEETAYLPHNPEPPSVSE